MLSPDWVRTDEEKRVARVLEEIATEVGAQTIQAGMQEQLPILSYGPNFCAWGFQLPSRTYAEDAIRVSTCWRKED